MTVCLGRGNSRWLPFPCFPIRYSTSALVVTSPTAIKFKLINHSNRKNKPFIYWNQICQVDINFQRISLIQDDDEGRSKRRVTCLGDYKAATSQTEDRSITPRVKLVNRNSILIVIIFCISVLLYLIICLSQPHIPTINLLCFSSGRNRIKGCDYDDGAVDKWSTRRSIIEYRCL